jgi:hypothetical protein
MIRLFLSGLLVCVFSGIAEAQDAEQPGTPRRYHEIEKDLRELLKLEATAITKSERVAAIYEMLPLYREIRYHPRRLTSPTLERYRFQLRSRLLQIQNRLKRELARQAQESPRATSLAEATTNAVIDQMSLVGASAGGPSQLFASKGAFGGAARPPDFGLALVELIQATIEPDSWDVHGGPGTIVYYAPLHALVVRATSEVHHKIGGAVRVIRQVGN